VFVGDKTERRQNPTKSTQSSPPSAKRVSPRLRRTSSPTRTNVEETSPAPIATIVWNRLRTSGSPMQRRGCSDASPVQRELPEVRGGRVEAGCGNTATIQCVRGLQVVDGRGFEVRRDATFGMVENGVQTSGNLFYTGKLDLSKCSHD